MAAILPYRVMFELRGLFSVVVGAAAVAIRAPISGRFRGRHGCGSHVLREML
ncbi:hypothetical protein [Nocardia beijingensis]